MSTPTNNYASLPVVDNSVLDELKSVLDTASVNGIVQDFQSLSCELVKQLSQASAQNNIEQLSSISHSLKSNCMQLGAVRLGELCHQLEEGCRTEQHGNQKDYVSLIEQTLPTTLELLGRD